MAKEINLPSAIEEILDRRQMVTLVGLGSLQLENLSSRISKEFNKITPPRVQLSFFEAQGDNAALKKYLVEKYNISEKKASTAISDFSEIILNAISNYGSVTIKGIGQLKRHGGAIVIEPFQGFLDAYTQGLPNIPIEELNPAQADELPTEDPLPLKEETIEPSNEDELKNLSQSNSRGETEMDDKVSQPSDTHDSSPSITEDIDEQTDAEQYDTTNDQVEETKNQMEESSKISSPIPVNVPKLQPQESPSLVIPKEIIRDKQNINQDPSPMTLNDKLKAEAERLNDTKTVVNQETNNQSTYTPYVEPESSIMEVLGPLLAFIGLLILGFFLFKALGCNDPKTKTSASTVENQITQDGEASSALIDTISNGLDTIKNKYNYTVPPDGNCIIITGSFSQYKNISRMANKIESAGYTLYKGSFGPYTRVGFSFDCKETNLSVFLNEIRSELEPLAWYLQPDLEVPYE